jgi:AcrR family transcriptional regulator
VWGASLVPVGRPAKFDVDGILDATAALVADGGPTHATIANIAGTLGAPSGSIYHRFPTRDLVLAQLWIRTVRRAQLGFLDAITEPDVELSARRAVLHLPHWTRSHLAEARVLLLYRRQDLADQWPGELGDELAHLNDGLRDAIVTFARRRFGRATKTTLTVTRYALIDIPYAGVRSYLADNRTPPPLLDNLIFTAAQAVLNAHAATTPR